MGPEISIIMPVYNAMPYLIRALDSLLTQTCGQDRMEIIAIDDGSTDGSGEVLDRYAAEHPSLTVVHQENSGLPSGPRNLGLQLARGEYVFFCDSDDYMGEEACERLLAHAREWNSDVVLAKLVGVGGRQAPKSMFLTDQPQVDLYSSRVTWTLGPWKLFRRSLLVEHGITFPEDALLEDIVFVLRAYFRADVVSVAADYDYYFYSHRADGENITTSERWNRIDQRFKGLKLAMEEIAESSDPARRDEVLMVRIFRDEVAGVAELITRCPSDERVDWIERVRGVVAPLYSRAIAAHLPLSQRMQVEAIMQADPQLLDDVVADAHAPMGRIQAQDTALGVRVVYSARGGGKIVFASDDAAIKGMFPRYQVHMAEWSKRRLRLSGVFCSPIIGLPRATLWARQYENERLSFSCPVEVLSQPEAVVGADGSTAFTYAWEASLDVSQLLALHESAASQAKRVRWDFYMTIDAHGTTRDIRVGSERTEAAITSFFAGCALLGDVMFVPYQTGYSNMSLHATSDWKQRLAPREVTLGWESASKGRLTVTAEAPFPEFWGLKYRMLLRRLDRPARRVEVAPLGAAGRICTAPLVRDGSALSGVLALGKFNGAEPLSDGEWEFHVVTESAGGLVRLSVGDVALPEISATRFRRRFHFYEVGVEGVRPPVIRIRRRL